MAANQVTIGYWGGFHGKGIIVQLVAELAGVPYVYKQVMSKEEFYGGLDQTLPTDFPNLPYLLDGDKALTQTSAILEYLAYKGGKEELVGKTSCQRVHVHQLMGVAADMRTKVIFGNFANANFQAEKDQLYESTFKAMFQRLAKHLGTNKFFTGDQVTIADADLANLIGGATKMFAKFQTDFPTLVGFVQNFKTLPEISAFLNSDRFDKNMPMLPPHGPFGGV